MQNSDSNSSYNYHYDPSPINHYTASAPPMPSGYDYNQYSTPNHLSNYGSSYPSAPYGDQDFYNSDVYKYTNGTKDEWYSERRSKLMFDDYGRPINIQNGRESYQGYVSSSSSKVVKATPKMDKEQQGVLNFHVKLLSEGVGQSDMDVLCQIGLGAIRVLDLATIRTLRIYLLENLTRWEVLDTDIFAFWAKTSVDMEPRCIRLKSNIYTINNILDTVAVASIQIKELREINRPSDSTKGSDQAAEKKKDFWILMLSIEGTTAGIVEIFFCDKCTQGRVALTADEDAQPVRVCDRCMAEVTQRLSNAKEAMTNAAALRNHENLARNSKEEMEKKRMTSTGLSSQGSSRMREVECPTCTVHLQVELPASGSERIECSVCQHPFLVSAN